MMPPVEELVLLQRWVGSALLEGVFLPQHRRANSASGVRAFRTAWSALIPTVEGYMAF
jgi:hypothetical protein